MHNNKKKKKKEIINHFDHYILMKCLSVNYKDADAHDN
jgi:hypothetical protein